MGKRLERRAYVLTWDEGTYLAGAEVRIRATPISVMEELNELRFSESIPLLLEYLESWNLEDENGEPIKQTEAAVKESLELPVLKEIVQRWIDAATGVTAPLDPLSRDGRESPDTALMEQSMPMEIPSSLPEN